MPPPFHTGSRVVRRLLAWVFVLLIASGAAAAWWLHEPLATGAEPLELAIEPGTTPRGVARDVWLRVRIPTRNCSTPGFACLAKTG